MKIFLHEVSKKSAPLHKTSLLVSKEMDSIATLVIDLVISYFHMYCDNCNLA